MLLLQTTGISMAVISQSLTRCAQSVRTRRIAPINFLGSVTTIFFQYGLKWHTSVNRSFILKVAFLLTNWYIYWSNSFLVGLWTEQQARYVKKKTQRIEYTNIFQYEPKRLFQYSIYLNDPF